LDFTAYNKRKAVSRLSHWIYVLPHLLKGESNHLHKF
jgi:hypothetical protein